MPHDFSTSETRLFGRAMWLLARSASPEELISTVTSAALRLTSAMRAVDEALETGADATAAQANAQMASATVDKQLQELKLILIGECLCQGANNVLP